MASELFKSIEYIEIYASNAFQSACFYKAAFSFDIIAQLVNDPTEPNKVSYLLKQASVNLIISSSTDENSPISKYIKIHDEGIKDVAFSVTHVEEAYNKAMKTGAVSIQTPVEIFDGITKIKKATVAAFGSTVHTFIKKEESASFILPHYIPLEDLNDYKRSNNTQECAALKNLDHIAIAVEGGALEKWKKFYEDIMGLTTFYKENIYTPESGMKSIALKNSFGTIKIVIVEGIRGEQNSKIENYILRHNGPGVQHIAFATQDVISSINYIQKQGVKFLKYPLSYYENLPKSLKKNLNPILEDIKNLSILVDLEEGGYLMQVFTSPLQNRPTFFIELIQRENSIGFGINNVKNLYKALK